jgi:hypothetical protein
MNFFADVGLAWHGINYDILDRPSHVGVVQACA